MIQRFPEKALTIITAFEKLLEGRQKDVQPMPWTPTLQYSGLDKTKKFQVSFMSLIRMENKLQVNL